MGPKTRVNGVYRDWKTTRLERLSSDHLGSAYAAGAFVAFAPGTPLKWVVRDVDGGELTLAIKAKQVGGGQGFNVGHAHPSSLPANAGNPVNTEHAVCTIAPNWQP